MNIILLRKNDFIDPDTVVLKGRRKEHILNVLKGKKGEDLFCGLVNGSMGPGRITAIDLSMVKLKVTLEQEPPPALPLTLVLALPRPKMLKRILESSTALGVKKIFLINAWRVEKSYWQSPVLRDENIDKILSLGLEQAKDTVMPELFKKKLFTPFVKQELKTISKDSMCITAHPKAEIPCPGNITCRTTLVLGPEGGFIDREIETLETIGFQSVNLGRRILRTETAVPVIISRLFSTAITSP